MFILNCTCFLYIPWHVVYFELDVGFLKIPRFVSGPGIADWTNAQNICRTQYRELAVVKSIYENEDTTRIIQSEPFWIGLFRDSWKWADGSPPTFENWEDQFPNTNYKDACAAVKGNGKWTNQNCEETRPYACYRGELPLLLLLFNRFIERCFIATLC